MRSEIGKISLDTVFHEREHMNQRIVDAVNRASEIWGISCLRYEIRDIKLPQRIQEAMQMQVEAERKKRAVILDSEGERDSQINRSEGEKQARILQSEAWKIEQINNAAGEAQALEAKANARANAIRAIGETIASEDGRHAAGFEVAEKYIAAFGKLANSSNTIVVPANTGDVASFVTQSLGIYKSLTDGGEKTTSSSSSAKKSTKKADEASNAIDAEYFYQK